MRYYFIGFMGAGKTYWGRKVAEAMHIPFFDLDQVIVDAEEQSIADIFTTKGEEYYRLKEQETLKSLAIANPHCIISCGGGVPCFYDNMAFMKQTGKTIWLNPGMPLLVQRLNKGKAHRPVIKHIADEDMEAFIIEKMKDRLPYYSQADIILAEEQLTLDTLLTIIQP